METHQPQGNDVSDPGIEVVAAQHGEVCVVAITGSIDALTADQLVDALGAQLRDGKTRIVADFAAVEYTSSAGLRVLLTTLKDARQRGGDLRLASIRPNVKQVLELSGFTSIIKCFADVPAAVSSFGA